ncbi:DNA methyltransferase [Bacillus coahuilensis m2-6]|uniref:DNA methyltransferase n=1 Tax=Bacillus coahuilensis p1.1.43 TaxID=1150625 RepID=A0A147K9W7_9BACI|nr:16S rRNA (guanine(966)-N(2))-methyltransferase RsmD [Bacillus coahuilensis]KUP07321.1 DNA methyltransferase [Bacillus coahuilensis p1.1.43]KUP08552.1 DNA methyltransferase [Bacillus coahuilensis m2-6]
MRVISGTKKGLRLKAVPGSGTRPTTDKVKEALFNMIGPYFDGGNALDLFAGSGGLGIEALSRGIEHVIFVDRDQKAIQTINQNLEFCKVDTSSFEVYRNDSDRALKAIARRDITFDLIFLDPPYKKLKYVQILTEISKHKMIDENGYVICEHSSEDKLPHRVENLVTTRSETYGTITITLYRVADEEQGES